MLDYSYMQPLVQDWIIRAAVKAWLWLTRSTAIVCRECGQELQVEALDQHTRTGCLQCGSTKLKAVKE